MNPQFWQQVKTALQHVLELDPESRRTYLEAQPEVLRREVESLIVAYAQSAVLEAALFRNERTSSSLDSGLIGRRFGPYLIQSLIGHGGMGSVWLAERDDGLFARRVALKLIHPALMNEVTLVRFAREREIVASLAHPHIARLFDAGITEDGQPYLALEYVSGTPITRHCDERHLSIPERLELFLQVLTAVQYAHSRLVIHRDLKPSNILVTESGQVQLLDFGIAKLLTDGEGCDTELTRLGGRALTPDYAAPEQIVGEPITPAADVYALGVLLYELLIGERPYELRRVSHGAREDAILNSEPLPPSRRTCAEAVATARGLSPPALSRTLRGDLDAITLGALQKSLNDRYPTAEALGNDIERFLRGEPVHAQLKNVVARSLNAVWRYRRAILDRTIVASVLIGLAIALWSARTTLWAVATNAQDSLAPRVLTPAVERRLRAGAIFKECSTCPEMVVIPAGRFLMGSAPSESGFAGDETPRHEVEIAKSLAVSRFEVTFDEWDTCVALRGCALRPSDDGFGRGRRPVINVSWNDVQQFIVWISKRTGKHYRLLTEAEWEFASRAGSTTAFSWGDDIGRGNANCRSCGSRWDNRQTAPVGSFAPNRFGLYDMQGNVFEWVQDCYHQNYVGAPSNGSAWENPCPEGHRILRGGAWGEPPSNLRVAHRDYDTASVRGAGVGFRLARVLATD